MLDFRVTLEARNPARHCSRQYRVAALRSVHGEGAVEGLSIYYLADEVAGRHRGMMSAIPEPEWAVSHGLTAVAFGKVLRDLAAGVRLSSYPTASRFVARSVRNRSGRAGRRSGTFRRQGYWKSGRRGHNSTFKALGPSTYSRERLRLIITARRTHHQRLVEPHIRRARCPGAWGVVGHRKGR